MKDQERQWKATPQVRDARKIFIGTEGREPCRSGVAWEGFHTREVFGLGLEGAGSLAENVLCSLDLRGLHPGVYMNKIL